MAWEFDTPVRIYCGRNMLQQLSSIIPEELTRVLVLTSPSMIRHGLVRLISEQLSAVGHELTVYSEIHPNPKDIEVEAIRDKMKKKEIQAILALGGGSVIDAAKAVDVLLVHGGRCSDYENGDVPKRLLPLYAIPTTCGTGSEVTHESIVNNTSTGEKDCIYGHNVIATAAILDANLLDLLPSHLVGSTGMDALTHAIEAYVCKVHNPLSDALAKQAIEMIARNILPATKNKDKDALEQMLIASTLAGIAFSGADVAAVHSISEALGGLYNIPHGIANGMLLADVSRKSLPGASDRYADVGSFLGIDCSHLTTEEAALAACDRMEELAGELGIPRFKELEEIDPKDFKRLAITAANAAETQDNPRVFSEEDFFNILMELYNT